MSCFGQFGRSFSNKNKDLEDQIDESSIDGVNEDVLIEIIAEIRRGACIDDIITLFVNTSSFRNALVSTVDKDTNLDILQLAVVYQRLDIVRFLFDSFKVTTFEILTHSFDVERNNPLSLACIVGSLSLIKYFVQEKGVPLSQASHASVEIPSLGIHSHFEDAKLPYQICIENGHLECANYICLEVVQGRSSLWGCRYGKQSYDDILHSACILGHPKHILQLLSDYGKRTMINARNVEGSTPLMMLCRNICDASVVAELCEESCLVPDFQDTSYKCSLNRNQCPCQSLVKLLSLFVRSGADLNVTDHNTNSTIDFLAYELGQIWPHHAWNKSQTYHILGSVHTGAVHLARQRDDSEKFHIVKTAICYLLESGASTVILDHYRGMVDHSLLHTVLQNCGWPLSNGLSKDPLKVAEILELLFNFGADAMVLAKNNSLNAFSVLLVDCLREIPKQHSVEIVHLFLQHGANPNALVKQPRMQCHNHADRRWNLYPILLVLQERHSIATARLLHNYMHLVHLYNALKLVRSTSLFHRMVWTPDDQKEYDDAYFRLWKQFAWPKVRSLKHSCKLSIVDALQHQALLAKKIAIAYFNSGLSYFI